MAKSVTLLEDLCSHVQSFGANQFETERFANAHQVFVMIDGAKKRVANFTAAMAREFDRDLRKALKKAVRSVIIGTVYEIGVQALDERRYLVTIAVAPKLDSGVKPRFTARQGAYLAFIHRYTEAHGCPPAEADLQRFFRVSAPSVHEMIKTLERNGLLEKTPGVARSIRLLVESKYLPKLRSNALWKNKRWEDVQPSSQQERHP
jgi:hypothetical protein